MKSRVLSLLSMIALAAAMLPATSAAQAVRLGDSFNVSPGLGSIRPDAAYDPVNDVFLTVSGVPGAVSRVHGRFIAGDGTPLGAPFYIGEFAGHHAMPQAAYSADIGGFVVIWLDNRRIADKAEIWGRSLKFQGDGTPAFLTGDFYIDNAAGGSLSSAPAGIACASGKNECLVSWQQMGESYFDIHALRISPLGAALGPEIFLTNDSNWDDQPAVAYDPASGNFLTVFKVWNNGANVAQVWAIPVTAGTGATGAVQSLVDSNSVEIPQVALNAATGQFLVTWYSVSGARVWGRWTNASGTPVSDPIPLVSGYSTYDALSVAYNEVSGTFFAVTNGLGVESAGFEIGATGVPSAPFNATGLGGNGNFNPTVNASSKRPEWLITVAASFRFVGGQRVTTNSRERAGGGPPPAPRPPSATIDLTPTGAPNGSWYLAEGAASAGALGYRSYYIVENPNPIPVTIRAYFSAEDGYTTEVNPTTNPKFTVPPNSRVSIDLGSVVPSGAYGAVFQSTVPGYDIAVERSMYWGPNMEGSTGATAVKTPSNTWYFAEGSRGGERFANYFLLFNPTQAAATANLAFYLDDGSVFGTTATVGPQARVTVDANSFPALANKNFAVVVNTTGAPVIAERAMYWGFDGPNMWIGGTDSVGATGGSARWYFAEGAAATGFQTYYLLWNPYPTPLWINATFSTEFAGVKTTRFLIPPRARYTVELNHEVGAVGGAAAKFWTDDGSHFIAERSSYWGGAAGWVEGANVFGTPQLAAEWHLPEGTTGGLFENYLMLYNPNDFGVDTSITLFFEGQTDGYTVSLPLAAGSRTTLNMRDFIVERLGRTDLLGIPFATRVRTAGLQAGIVAEHALYWNAQPGVFWRSGSATAGIPSNFR